VRQRFILDENGRRIEKAQPMQKAQLDLGGTWTGGAGADAQFPAFSDFSVGTTPRGYSQGVAPGSNTGGVLDLPSISATGTFGGNTLEGAQYTGGVGGDVVMPELADAIAPYIRQKSYMRSFVPTIAMRGYQLNIPKLTQGAIAYYVQEGVTSPTTAVGTGVVVLQAKKLMANMAITAELQEDNIIPILPSLKEEFAHAFALAEEEAMLLGELSPTGSDNTAVTYGSATLGNNKNMFDGLTHVGINNGEYTTNYNSGDGYGAPVVNVGGNPLTPQNFATALKNLNLFGRNRADLLAVISMSDLESLMTDETVLVALDRFGPQTQYVTGEVSRVYGIGVVVTNLLEISAHSFIDSTGDSYYLYGWDYDTSVVGRSAACPTGTTTAGGYDGRRRFYNATDDEATYDITDKREAFIFNRASCLIGDRRQFKLVSTDLLLIMSDQLLLVASERVGFCTPYPRGVCKLIGIADNS